MTLIPATVNIDFYIQADSSEEANRKLQNIIEKEAFRHDASEFPEIEQPKYCIGSVPNTKAPQTAVSNYERDEVLLDIAINMDFERLKIKYNFDSRDLVRAMMSWTDEFIKIHQNTDWEETDYFLTVDDFSDQRLAQFINELNY